MRTFFTFIATILRRKYKTVRIIYNSNGTNLVFLIFFLFINWQNVTNYRDFYGFLKRQIRSVVENEDEWKDILVLKAAASLLIGNYRESNQMSSQGKRAVISDNRLSINPRLI